MNITADCSKTGKSMNRKRMLLSLPLSLLILPPLLAGNPGLYYPLFWLAALLLSPFFTAPLLAGESASGTDLLLLTGPLTDRALLFRLLKKGAVSLGSLFILPVTFMSLIRLAGGEDPGKILFFLPLFTGGIFFLAALGLAVSSFCHRPGRAWFFSYAILLPLISFPLFCLAGQIPCLKDIFPLPFFSSAFLYSVLSGNRPHFSRLEKGRSHTEEKDCPPRSVSADSDRHDFHPRRNGFDLLRPDKAEPRNGKGNTAA